MLQKETLKRQVIELLCTDMLVPPEHLLRRIDAALDFTHIYDLVEDLYCEDRGISASAWLSVIQYSSFYKVNVLERDSLRRFLSELNKILRCCSIDEAGKV